MNENINLVKLLKGHEGETFYSPLCGECELVEIANNTYITDINPIKTVSSFLRLSFTKEGKYLSTKEGECIIFPSKEQRDWNKWVKEQKKYTWKELSKNCNPDIVVCSKSSIRSSKALRKILTLIEASYGGVPTAKYKSENPAYTFEMNLTENELSFEIHRGYFSLEPVAFYTWEDAEKFISYPENVELLKEYYLFD